MKTSNLILAALFGCALHGASAQQIENADFAKGKTGWMGDGKAVFIDEKGEVSETPKPGTTPAIRIELSKAGWKGIKQKLRPKANESAIQVVLQVKGDAAFKKAPESREYSNVDFREGGEYTWKAEVFPKCDFLIRVKDETWLYRPISLAPVDAWKTVTQSFAGLKGRQREIELLFPPGEGMVYLKGK